jgi:hypothetical protein
LFRISSIDPDALHAYTLHAAFANDLYQALNPSVRAMLFGRQSDPMGAPVL